MTNFIYFFTGGLCCYFSLVYPLNRKLSWQKTLTVLAYIYFICLVFAQRLGQLSSYLAVAGTLFLIYQFTDHDLYCLSCSLFGYLYAVTINYITLWSTTVLLQISEKQLLSSNRLSVIFNIFYCIICAVLTKLLGYLLNKKFGLKRYLTDSHTLKGIFTFLILLVLLFILHISYGENLGYTSGVTAFSAITFLSLFITAVFLMHSIYKNTQQTEYLKNQIQQYENLQLYTQKLEASYGTLRRFKHDYINIFTTMSGYIADGDLAALKEYFQQKITPLSRNLSESDHKLNDLKHISCRELKSILSSKLIYSMELGIQTGIEICEPIHQIFMDPLDISIIIGIFMDNAIEAALDTAEKEIHFAMFYKKASLVIIIHNSALPPVTPIPETRQLGTSSKSSIRGVGLYNVSQILKNYPNVLWNTSYQAPYFTQELNILPTKQG